MKEKFKQRLDENKFVDLANCRNTSQQEKYLEIYKKNYDPFGERSKIEDLGNEIISDTDYWIVIRNQHYKDPKRKHHFVVILKRFIKTTEELRSEEILDAFKTLSEINLRFQICGGALLMRYGDTRLSGASVKHLHFHIVEPSSNEAIPLYVGCKID
ncbi:HIT domain-containing protein [Candidatus Parcubacteria bacterium]|nr:HIT domain-containing protein [Candidatus Parcubacteria bacterium]